MKMIGIVLCMAASVIAQPYYVNSGGNQATDTAGTVWLPDNQTGVTLTGGTAVSTGVFISGTPNGQVPLYQTAIQGTKAVPGGVAQPFSYSFAISTPGTYNVTLKFDEFQDRFEGQRIFNVTDQLGKSLLYSYDIRYSSGAIWRPVDTTIQVTSCTGSLGLTFSPLYGDPPQVNAISVVFANGDACPPTPVAACGNLTTGRYRLSNDLSSSVNCLQNLKSTDKISLDCNGHSITETGDDTANSYALSLTGANSVVKNCAFKATGQATAFVIMQANNSLYDTNTSTATVKVSIIGQYSEVSHSTFNSQTTVKGDYSYIHDSSFSIVPSMGLASALLSSPNEGSNYVTGSRIVNNTFTEHYDGSSTLISDSALNMTGCIRCTISGNKVSNSARNGIELSGTFSGTVISNNTFTNVCWGGGITAGWFPSLDGEAIDPATGKAMPNEISGNCFSIGTTDYCNGNATVSSPCAGASRSQSIYPMGVIYPRGLSLHPELDYGQNIYFRGNYIHDNSAYYVGINPSSFATGGVFQFDYSQWSGSPRMKVGSNYFWNNRFGPLSSPDAFETMNIPGYVPFSTIIDRGGNICLNSGGWVMATGTMPDGIYAPLHCGAGITIYTYDFTGLPEYPVINGITNSLLNATFYVEGGPSNPPTYTVTHGTLPDGLTWNKVNNYTYTISGLPSTAGTSFVSIAATDAYSNTKTATFQFTIVLADYRCDGTKGAGSSDQPAGSANTKYVKCVYTNPNLQGTPVVGTPTLTPSPLSYSNPAAIQSASFAGWFYFTGGYYTFPMTYCGTQQLMIDGQQVCQRFSTTGGSSNCGRSVATGNHMITVNFFTSGAPECTATPTAQLANWY